MLGFAGFGNSNSNNFNFNCGVGRSAVCVCVVLVFVVVMMVVPSFDWLLSFGIATQRHGTQLAYLLKQQQPSTTLKLKNAPNEL